MKNYWGGAFTAVLTSNFPFSIFHSKVIWMGFEPTIHKGSMAVNTLPYSPDGFRCICKLYLSNRVVLIGISMHSTASIFPQLCLLSYQTVTPMGLEPIALGLKVRCSANWATRSLLFSTFLFSTFTLSTLHNWLILNCLTLNPKGEKFREL